MDKGFLTVEDLKRVSAHVVAEKLAKQGLDPLDRMNLLKFYCYADDIIKRMEFNMVNIQHLTKKDLLLTLDYLNEGNPDKKILKLLGSDDPDTIKLAVELIKKQL